MIKKPKEEACRITREKLQRQVSKLTRNKNIAYAIGIIGLIAGISFGFSIPLLVDQPFVSEPKIELGFTIGDFYIRNIETSEINYSYILSNFQVQGARFSDEDWEILKIANMSEGSPFDDPFFFEICLFGASGNGNETYQQAIDNNTWTTYEYVPIVMTGISLTIYLNDSEWFESMEINLYDYEIFETLEDYRFKSDSADQNIYIQINGISYNYTSNEPVELFIRYNNVPFIVPAYY